MALILRVGLVLAFAIATALIDAFDAVGDEATARVLSFASETLYLFIPGVVGIALATVRRVTRREAAVTIVLASALMFALDLAPASRLLGSEPRLLQTPDGWEFIQAESDRWNASGAVLLVRAHMKGEIPEADELQAGYSLDSPRLQVTQAYVKLFYLLGPLIVGGLVLGAVSWTQRHLLYRSRSGEVVVGFLLGWILGPAFTGLLSTINLQSVGLILFDGSGFAVMMLPYGTLLMFAAWGWYQAPTDPAR